MGLGDRIETALKLVGITPESVAPYLGENCGCDDRRERLNQIGYWAERVIKGNVANARMYLSGIIGVEAKAKPERSES